MKNTCITAFIIALLAWGAIQPSITIAQQSNRDKTIIAPPLLTKAMMEEHATLVQTLLDLKYTPQQKAVHFDLLNDYWLKNDTKGMQAVASNLEFYEQLKQFGKSELDATVKMVRSSLIINLVEGAKAGEADSRWYLQNYYAAHPPLLKGEIPFLQETADALLDAEYFINATLKNQKVSPVTQTQRESAYKELARQWESFDAAQKKMIMQGASHMSLIFYRWKKMNDSEKAMVKLQYVGEQYLTLAEQNAYLMAQAQQAQIAGGQQFSLLQNELYHMKQTTDIIMGRGIRWDPSRNCYVQDGGIVTEFW